MQAGRVVEGKGLRAVGVLRESFVWEVPLGHCDPYSALDYDQPYFATQLQTGDQNHYRI